MLEVNRHRGKRVKKKKQKRVLEQILPKRVRKRNKSKEGIKIPLSAH